MDTLALDLRLALRRIASRPLFTAVAVATLAIGIGAVTAVFSVVHAVLLEPLGFEDEGSLVALVALETDATGSNPSATPVKRRLAEAPGHSAPDVWYFRRHARQLGSVVLWAGQSVTLEQPGKARQMLGYLVSWDAFAVLGLHPSLGRTFSADDERPGFGDVAVVSHGAWQREWGGDSTILGRSIVLDGRPTTVIGVMPPGTDFPYPGVDLWLPAGEHDDPTGRFSPEERDFHAFARLAEGVGRASAEQEARALAASRRAEEPASLEGWDVGLVPLRHRLVGDSRPAILVAFAGVGLVLLIACANVANLVLVRALGRRREMAIRAALGASRKRLAHQSLIEGLLRGVSGGGAGLLMAVWLHELLLSLDPGILPRSSAIDLELPVLLFAAVVAMGAGLFFGVLPSLGPLFDATGLRPGGRAVGVAPGQARMRHVLVAGEIALALVLSAGALLLASALHRLQQTDLGFEPRGLLASHVILDPDGYLELETRRQYFAEVVESVRAIPGVRAAAATTTTPIPGFGIQMEVAYRFLEGPPADAPGAPRAALRVIT
ncbi:MAG: ABC transporter permease, partial [Holophagales bacterium]|nr:ABC transporter permease [Holophagales bacterium]